MHQNNQRENNSGGKYHQNHAKRRLQILESAARCFLKSGFAETTLELIAKEGGFVKQTIYNYFSTKEDLFSSSLAFVLQDFAIELDDQWYELSTEDFFFQVGALQLDKLQSSVMTDFLQLAVKESRSMPIVQERYAQAVIEPMINYVAHYLAVRFELSEGFRQFVGWSFRAAVTGFGTLVNLNGTNSSCLPSKTKFLRTTSSMFSAMLKNTTENQFHSVSNKNFAANPSIAVEPEKFFARKRESRYLDTDAAILAACVSTFVARGFADTSMEQIALAAKVSKQTVYSRFGNKELLFKSMCKETMSRLQSINNAQRSRHPKEHQSHLDLSVALLEQMQRPWLRDFFHVVIRESSAFPVEAGMALSYLYEFGRDHLEAQILSEFGDKDSQYASAKSIALTSTVATFILLRQIYEVGNVPPIGSSSIVELMNQLYEY